MDPGSPKEAQLRSAAVWEELPLTVSRFSSVLDRFDGSFDGSEAAALESSVAQERRFVVGLVVVVVAWCCCYGRNGRRGLDFKPGSKPGSASEALFRECARRKLAGPLEATSFVAQLQSSSWKCEIRSG